MSQKPQYLYRGSTNYREGPLKPILKKRTLDHTHTRPIVFATERIDIASLFMFPIDTLSSIGFEDNTAYICIWGTTEEFKYKDRGGFIYILPSDSFEKVGKEYEWQSFEEVEPLEVKRFESIVGGMIQCGAKVYFINDNNIFDQIRDDKYNRMPILEKLKPL